jgi:hypothetical protein
MLILAAGVTEGKNNWHVMQPKMEGFGFACRRVPSRRQVNQLLHDHISSLLLSTTYVYLKRAKPCSLSYTSPDPIVVISVRPVGSPLLHDSLR